MGKTVYHTHTCVGGHLDGQRYAPEKSTMLSPTSFRFRKVQPLYRHRPLSIAEAAKERPVTTRVVDEIYEAESVRTVGSDGADVQYFFWRHKDVAIHTALGMLFEGYGGSKNRE